MSLSIKRSVIEEFNFNGTNVRSVYVKEVGECLIAGDVYTSIGHNRESGLKALQRHVPDKYKMRLGDAGIDIEEVDRSVHLHPDTILLKEPGLYCFLLRCGKAEAEPFMEWVVETVLPKEVRKLTGIIEEKEAAMALLADDLEDNERQVVVLEQENRELQSEVKRLQERYVPRLQDSKKDNGMV